MPFSLVVFPMITLVTIVIQRLMYRRYSKIGSPTEEQRIQLMHQLGWVLIGAIAAMLISLFVLKLSVWGVVICWVGLVLLGVSQRYIRCRAMHLPITFLDVFKTSVRSNGFLLMILVCVYGPVLMPDYLRISSEALGAGLTIGLVILGIFSLKLLSPRTFAWVHGTKELQDPDLLALIHHRFEQAKLPKLRVDVWPIQHMKVANALVIGVVHAPRFFQGRIVLTDSLLKDFSHTEIDAIITHEISHFLQKHLSKRIWISLFLVYGAMACVFVSMLLRKHLHTFAEVPHVSQISMIIFLSASYVLALIYFAFVQPRKIVYNQELDADWMAIHHFGVHESLYFDTLDKLVTYSGESTKKQNPLAFLTVATAHPTNTERRRLVKEASHYNAAPFERASLKRLLKNSGTVALIIMILPFTMQVRSKKTDRQAASESLSPMQKNEILCQPAGSSEPNPKQFQAQAK